MSHKLYTFFCFCFIVVIWSIHSVYMLSIYPDPSGLLHWLEAARLDCIVYWYFHGHLQNRLIYSIVLSDYISFSFYKSFCRHDIYWILVAFMIAASALIKISRLYGLYRHLYTQLIYWHCAVILYTHVNLLNERFWILHPESLDDIMIVSIWNFGSATVEVLVNVKFQNDRNRSQVPKCQRGNPEGYRLNRASTNYNNKVQQSVTHVHISQDAP